MKTRNQGHIGLVQWVAVNAEAGADAIHSLVKAAWVKSGSSREGFVPRLHLVIQM